jgi:hypothetical protein
MKSKNLFSIFITIIAFFIIVPQIYAFSNSPITPDQIRVYDLDNKSLWHNRFAHRLTDYFRRSNSVTMFNAEFFLEAMVDSSGAFEMKPSEKFKSNISRYKQPVEYTERIILEEMEHALAHTTAYAIDEYGFNTFKKRAALLIQLASE